MRILCLSPGGHALGGAERSLTLLVAELVARGHAVHALVLGAGDLPEALRRHGATVTSSPTPLRGGARHGTTAAFVRNAAGAAPSAIRVAALLRSVTRRFCPDVIHSNGFRTHVVSSLLPHRPPVVWSLRDVPPAGAPRRVLRLAARRADAVAATSAFTAAAVAGVAKRIETIPNPVAEIAIHDRASARRVIGLPDDRPLVMVSSHFHPSKGQHLVLDALERFPAERRPCVLLIGGELYGQGSTEYVASLRERIARAGLGADVVLHAPVEDLGLLYGAADVVVIPSVHPEGFGRVAVEAQRAGVPVVAAAHGGPVELIDDGRTGLLVPPGDVEALARAIHLLLEDQALRDDLTGAGRAAGARYEPAEHARAMTQLFIEVTR